MGWHKRGSRRYYFRSVREGKIVEKVYFGAGPVADLAAQSDRLKQFDQQQQKLLWDRGQKLIEEAVHAFEALDGGADLLQSVVLLTSGFHRTERRRLWRGWRDGRRALKQSD